MNSLQEKIDVGAVKFFLRGLQDDICAAIEHCDGNAQFQQDEWQHKTGGGGRSRILRNGSVFEQAGVGFSHVTGDKLPAAASASRPQIAGKRFEAMGVSLVFHPWNPHVPATHLNVRFFIAYGEGDEPIWWFGGGFDLTPFYPVEKDVVHWHETARAACILFGDDLYPRCKNWCDEYFFLKHRNETRGVGGLFFDDFNEGNFGNAFAFQRSVGEHFLEAYLPIVERRKDKPYAEREREFQLYRRGRYVEFNLIFDRGTLFGLQSGGRTESILMSLPPLARWEYGFEPEAGSKEAELYERYLKPQDWLGIEG